jgi:amidase
MLEQTLDVDGQKVPSDLQLVLPMVAGLPGQPATAFPVTRTASGLPIGLQAIGPYLEDRTPIRFAGLMARRLGGFQPPPRYA